MPPHEAVDLGPPLGKWAESASWGIANALTIAGEARPYSEALYRSAQESFVQGWQQAMWAGTVVMAVLLVYVLVGGPRRPPPTSRGGVGSDVVHPPREFPDYPPPYYATFWLDPFGIMLEAVCHYDRD